MTTNHSAHLTVMLGVIICVVGWSERPRALAGGRYDQQAQSLDRTAALLQSMSSSERARSKRFNGLGTQRIIDQQLSIVVHMERALSVKADTASLAAMACNFDVVAIGIIGTAKSMPSDDGRYIFTDHQVQVVEVLRDRVGDLRNGATMVFSRPGGSVLSGDTVVSVSIAVLPPLIVGERYLVIGKKVPDADGYYAGLEQAAFRLTSDRLRLEPGGSVSLRGFRDALSGARCATSSEN